VDWFTLTLTWYLMTLLVTVAIAPLALWLCRGLTDRGASVARPIAVLAMVWPVWLLASIGSGFVPFSRVSLWVSLVLIAIVGWVLAWRGGLVDRTAIRHLLIAEAGFLFLFALFVWFHGYGPQIMDQEKPGDMMMLASSMRATQMPPNDAWMAGDTINYYYLGYVLWAAIGKMVGAAPAEAFNLALASVFGMVGVAATGLAGNIVGHWFGERIARVAGVLGLLFVVLVGTPWAAFTALGNWSLQWTAFFFDPGIGWGASRVIHDVITVPPDTIISEFPAFSFILGDLHPHLLALPYTITALTISWALAQWSPVSGDAHHADLDEQLKLAWTLVARIAVSGAIVGALYAMNSWDMPTYLLITAVGLLVGLWHYPVRTRITGLIALALSSVLAWLPFYVAFKAPTIQGQTGIAGAVQGIPVVGGILASVVGYQGERTSAGEYLSVFGFVWVIALVLIAIEFWNRRRVASDSLSQKTAIGAAVILILGALLIPAPVVALAGLPIVAVIILIQRDPRLTASNVALALFGFGFAITILPEFFYLADIFNNRMNTIFKLYYQVWLLMAIASAISIVVVWSSLRPLITARIATIVVAVGTVAILLLGATYPVVASKQWLDWRNPAREWSGIDGLAYLDDPQQSWSSPGEYAALQWLWKNGTQDDVLLAQSGCEWGTDIGRTASATGIQSILGWDGHEQQWHLADPEIYSKVTERIADVNTLFTQPTPELLDKYSVTLIYIGPVETNGSSYTNSIDGPTCAKGPFPGANNPSYPGAGWSEVYNAEGVRIYRRDGL
jgi:YYY domain-containing protein